MTVKKIKKAFQRLFRSIFLTLFVALVLISATVAVAFKYFITVDSVVAYLSGEMEEHFNRQILVGSAKVSLWGGIDLRDVKISEHPNFREGVFAEVARFQINPNLVELLTARVRADEFKIFGAKIRLFRRPDGRWNLGRLEAASQEPKVLSLGQEDHLLPMELDVDRLRIEDSEFILEDSSGSIPSVHLSGINLAMRRLTFREPLAVSGSLMVKFLQPPQASQVSLGERPGDVWLRWFGPDPIRAGFKMAISAEGGDLNLLKISAQEFSIDAGSWSMTLSGKVSPFLEKTANVAANLNIGDYRLTVAGEPMFFSGQAKLDVFFDFKSSHKSINLSLNAGSLNYDWKYCHKPRHLPLSANLDINWKTPETLRSHEEPRPRVYEAEGSVSWTTRPGLTGQIGQWTLLMRPQSEEDGEDFPAWPMDKGGLSEPPSWELIFSSISFQAAMAPALVPALSSFPFSGGVVRAQELKLAGSPKFWSWELKNAGLTRGKMAAPISIRNIEAAVELLSISGQSPRWDIHRAKGALMINGANTPFLTCRRLISEGDFGGVANVPQPELRGEIHTHLENGGLRNIPELAAAAPFMSFLVYPLRIVENLNSWKVLRMAGQDFRNFPMDVMQGDYYFEKGKMNLDKITVKGPLGNVQVSGGVDFPRDQIDLLVAINIPGDKISWPMADAFSDEKGNAYLHLKVKGPITNPPVYPVLRRKKVLLEDIENPWKALRERTQALFKKILRKEG